MSVIIEINKKNLLWNVESISKLIGPDKKKMFIIKANAYGHGIREILKIVGKDKNIDYFAVFDIEEGIIARSLTKKPILVLSGLIDKKDYSLACKYNLSVTIASIRQLKIVSTLDCALTIYIKVDTGLNRQGFLLEDKEEILKILKSLPKNIKVESLYSHLSSSEDAVFDKHTESQFDCFYKWDDFFIKNNYKLLTHITCSAASFRVNRELKIKNDFPIYRYGIAGYGLYSSEYIEKKYKNKLKLKPVLSMYSRIIDIKKIKKGYCVGYDITYIAKKETIIAVLPIGYYNGVPRFLSNKGHVIINNNKYPIIGRVMMNMTIIDITNRNKNTPVKIEIGDKAYFIGGGPSNAIRVEEIAKLCHTINYETVTNLKGDSRIII